MNNDDFTRRSDEMVKEDFDYTIPNEGVCSAEFPGGCILCEE